MYTKIFNLVNLFKTNIIMGNSAGTSLPFEIIGTVDYERNEWAFHNGLKKVFYKKIKFFMHILIVVYFYYSILFAGR